jgi:hypothetical protein
MRLDSDGIPRAWYRTTGAQYWPAYVAWYGLVHLGSYLRRGERASLDVFLKQVSWLERNAVLREDGAVVWPMEFDYPMGSVVLKAPWVSAHAQGLAISAVVRGWRVTRRIELLKLLTNAAQVFALNVEDNGVRVLVNGRVLYTEFPGGPLPGIQDGFMTSLLALYDLFVETGNAVVGEYFRQGIEGLRYALPRWDYRKKWSWYGSRAYLCPPAYHCLNRLLLQVLAGLSQEPAFADYAGYWDPDHLSVLDRAEIYTAFLVTKNLSRLRHRTWTYKLKRTEPIVCRSSCP